MLKQVHRAIYLYTPETMMRVPLSFCPLVSSGRLKTRISHITRVRNGRCSTPNTSHTETSSYRSPSCIATTFQGIRVQATIYIHPARISRAFERSIRGEISTNTMSLGRRITPTTRSRNQSHIQYFFMTYIRGQELRTQSLGKCFPDLKQWQAILCRYPFKIVSLNLSSPRTLPLQMH